jgi:hypothetical protein
MYSLKYVRESITKLTGGAILIKRQILTRALSTASRLVTTPNDGTTGAMAVSWISSCVTARRTKDGVMKEIMARICETVRKTIIRSRGQGQGNIPNQI